MQEHEQMSGWLWQERTNAGGAEAVDLLHAAILAPLRPFCKLPAVGSDRS
jgi:hypothetical protein